MPALWLRLVSVALAAMGTMEPAAGADDIVLGRGNTVVFASPSDGRDLLGKQDAFIAALSPFDRAARLKSAEPISEERFIHHVRENVRAWEAAEEASVRTALKSVAPLLARWPLNLPQEVILIKTTGAEEGGAAYTRHNAIILPAGELRGSERGLEDLLLHELFHVLSRHDAALRATLYAKIGFTRIPEVAYPTELRSRKITNPDGVETGWVISVTHKNAIVSAVPILYSSVEKYDPGQGGEFFQYLQFKLLVVERAKRAWRPALARGKPLLLEPATTPGYLDQIGRNTDYIIHPDEVLAVNFVHLVRGKTGLPTPGLLEEMDQVLRARRD
jgi:hypothetical protein